MKNAPQGILLGRDRGNAKELAWYEGQGHLLTIAPARSGKLVSSIGPNVFFHTGSLFAVDPKGEIAHAFGRLREEGYGQPTYYLNPGHMHGLPCHAVNPLAWLQADSRTLASDAAMIADALIEREPGNHNRFWRDEAVNLVMGLAVHCALDPDMPDFMRNLVGVRRCLELEGEKQETLFKGMATSQYSEVRAVASMIGGKSENERASVFSTARSNTHFLGDKAIQEVLTGNTCDLRNIKREKISIFLLIPPEYLGAWRNWYRLMVSLAINIMMKQEPAPAPQALFVLDELYAMGNLESIELASGLMPGMGLRLHLVMQSLSQLESRYEEIYQDLIANSGVVQAFNVSSPKDAHFLQDMMQQRPMGVNASGFSNYQPGERVDQIMYQDPERVFVRVQGQWPRWFDKVPYFNTPEIKASPLFQFVNTNKPL